MIPLHNDPLFSWISFIDLYHCFDFTNWDTITKKVTFIIFTIFDLFIIGTILIANTKSRATIYNPQVPSEKQEFN